MIAEHLALLEASLDRFVEFETFDGTRFLGMPLFVYCGEDNPDVFVLPVEREADGRLMPGKAGLSILLEDIVSVRPIDSD